MAKSSSSPDAMFRAARLALKANDFPKAEASFMQGLEQDPTNEAVWLELSRAYLAQGNVTGALMAVEGAQAAAPHSAGPFLQQAQIYQAAGNAGQMFAAWEAAYKIVPTPALANTIAVAYLKQKLPGRSLPFLRDLIRAEPMQPMHRYRLAAALHESGQTLAAVPEALALVQAAPEDIRFLTLYAAVMQHVSLNDQVMALADHKRVMTRILTSPDIAPQTIAFSVFSILKATTEYDILRRDVTQYRVMDIARLAGDPFLLAALTRLKTMHDGLEPWITGLRRAFLLYWRDDAAMLAAGAELLAALAISCWYSDYVFAVTDAERDVLTSQPPLPPVLRACYEPLTDAGDMSDGPYEQELIRIQIDDMAAERALYDHFTPLHPIENATSQAVQKMYEARPYPRWQHVMAMQQGGLMGQTGQGLNLLIGGCGTGQEILYFAANLVDLRIIAIDLSRASLAYAKRKADQFGYASRVTFYHGDLLDAPHMNRTFDVVSSTGVLHHLKDPAAGLQSLLTCLAPGGRLHLALYAHHARTHYLGAAKAMAEREGVSADADDIRDFRQRLLALPPDDPARRVTRLMDFYSLNECTDLLFHVQECWYSLQQLRELLDQYGLELMTMKLQPMFKTAYLRANPTDRMIRNWDALIAFEGQADPAAFIGMYDFWVKRKDDAAPHALDPLIARQMI